MFIINLKTGFAFKFIGLKLRGKSNEAVYLFRETVSQYYIKKNYSNKGQKAPLIHRSSGLSPI